MQKPLYELSVPPVASPTMSVTCKVFVKLYILGVIWPKSEVLVSCNIPATSLREKISEVFT